METFVDRHEELERIAEVVRSIQSKKSAARTPIFEFHGVGGIGKTTLLKRVVHYCDQRQVRYIWADASKSLPLFSYDIIDQVRKYQVQIVYKADEQDLLHQFIAATKMLLAQGALVILLDSLDAASQEQLAWIAELLRYLIDDNQLFVILASKRKIPFENMRSLALKLDLFQLEPFDADSCRTYLEHFIHNIKPEIRDTILEWTRGYPLAVNVMVQQIYEKQLDPGREEDQRALIAVIVEQVFKRGVFSDQIQPSTDIDWYLTMLSLLSMTRRSIFPIIRKLVERFAPHYALSSHLKYLTLPKRINQATEVLTFERSMAGFVVEKSIRHIFMLKLKIEQPVRYYEIHDFLAQDNKRQAEEVAGWDRMRYILEYLYHAALGRDTADLPHLLEKTIAGIIAGSSEDFTLFYEEYKQDMELQTVLGEHAKIVFSLICRELARINWAAASDADSNRAFYFKEFFYYVICDPLMADLPTVLKLHIQQVAQEVPASVATKLYSELISNQEIKSILRQEVALFAPLLRDSASSEGKG